MTKIAIACTFGFALYAGGARAEAPAAAPAAPGTAQTVDCGKIIKEKAVMPAKASELHGLVSQMLEAHSKLMAQGKSKEAKAEGKAVAKIAREHKQISDKLKSLSDAMANNTIVSAEHEAPKPDPTHTELMNKLISTEKELAMMLKTDAEAMEKMLSGKK